MGVRLWDFTSGECLAEFSDKGGSITCLVADWATGNVISGSREGKLQVFEHSSKQCIRSCWMANQNITCMAVERATAGNADYRTKRFNSGTMSPSGMRGEKPLLRAPLP